jgi:murein DD-endopeptidase MepM/ murein hydrolase activator NlpD
MAVKDGEVTHAGWQNGYGNCVEIKHTDEQGNTFYTFYAHMRDNSLQVTKGQQVKTGQIIGTQGSTGNSTGDHLHFEVRTDGGSNKYAIDPAPYLFTEKGVD